LFLSNRQAPRLENAIRTMLQEEEEKKDVRKENREDEGRKE
jgi:hypothetical protein